MIDTKDKEIESAYHLVHLCIEIVRAKELLTEISKSNLAELPGKRALQLVTKSILIDASSFIDEYNAYFNSKTVERVKQVRAVIKPLIKQINSWTDIKEYRNKMLAHNYRLGKSNSQSVFNEGQFLKFDVPRRLNEMRLLVWCFETIKITLKQFYGKELQNFNQDIKIHQENKESWEDLSELELNTLKQGIFTEVELKKIEFGK